MLKKISVVLCAGLFATTLAAGCKKDSASAGGGCDDMGKKMKSQMSSEMPKGIEGDAKKAAEEMGSKMVDMVVKHCKDDKWDAAVVKCANTAKDPRTECMGKLTADQQKKIEDDMMKAMGGAMGAGVLTDGDDKGEEAGTGSASGSGTASGSADGAGTASGSAEGSAAGSGSAEGSAAGSGEGTGTGAAADPAAAGEPAAAGGTGLANCDAIIEMTAKLAKCDKLDDATKKSIADSAEAMKTGWGDTSAMDEATKKAMDDGCKQSLDGMKQGYASFGCDL